MIITNGKLKPGDQQIIRDYVNLILTFVARIFVLLINVLLLNET